MSEQQFWESNPRIIKVYDKIYREKIRVENKLIHAYVGNYVLSALYTAIDGVLNGKKAKAKYIEEPIEIFTLTEEEKDRKEKEKQQQAIAQFMGWAKSTKTRYGKEGKDGFN